MSQALALENPPQIDENGIPILKGYRPPFKPGYDPRRKAQPPGKPRTSIGSLTPKAASILLAAIRRAFRRHAKASEIATDADEAMRRAKVARLFFDMEMELTGHGSTHPKHGYKPHLQKSAMVEPVAPIEPQNSPTIEPASVDKNASQVRPEAKNLPAIPKTEHLPDQA